MAALTLSLDHIILPKDVTDEFYSTWHNYYGELFPSPVKPKYRPMSKIFGGEGESITQSSPNLLDKVKSPLAAESQPLALEIPVCLSRTSRVGDDIDEFIRNNRKEMCRSNSLNDLIKDFDDTDIFAKVLDENNKQTEKELGIQPSTSVKMRTKSDSVVRGSKTNRFSWCSSSTLKFLTNLPGKKKVYDCVTEQAKFDESGNGAVLRDK
ncbi:uncharacterized protein [Clytia hemisphaerica]|uniref:Uncharacterized protein n=1 Tax=Clytia hemisphaerica TaxID=252671 RepID=A0A7M5V3X1_9CNID